MSSKIDGEWGGMCRAAMLVLSMGFATAAVAEEPIRLTKADVEAIAVGKKLQYVRASDGSTVTFDVKDNGTVFFSPPKTQRNLTISGNYVVGDDGSLCFKWNQDKYYPMQDGCFLFVRDGSKTHLVGKRNPDRVLGDLAE